MVALRSSAQRGTFVLLTIVVAAALLSHPSTCAILAAVLAATAHSTRGTAQATRRDRRLSGAASSAVIAVVCTTRGFPSVYFSELAARSREHPFGVFRVAPDGRSVPAVQVLHGKPTSISDGPPSHGGDRPPGISLETPISAAHSASSGLGGICLVFLALGILTPIEIAITSPLPMLAVAAAFACSGRGAALSRFGSRSRRSSSPACGMACAWLWAMTTYARIVRLRAGIQRRPTSFDGSAFFLGRNFETLLPFALAVRFLHCPVH